MDRLYALTADAATLLGILLCLLAGIGRLAGFYHILTFESLTLLNVGIGLLVLACLAKLYQLTSR